MSDIAKSWFLVVALSVVVGVGVGALVRGTRFEHDPMRLSRSASFKVRIAATRMLAAREDDDSQRRIRALLDDPHPLVRRVAHHALVRSSTDSIAGMPVGVL